MQLGKAFEDFVGRKDDNSRAALDAKFMIYAERLTSITFNAYLVNNETNQSTFIGMHTIPNGQSFLGALEQVRDNILRTLGDTPL